MEAMTEKEIRGCFVNGSRGEVARINLPDLAGLRWEESDFVGWVDPRSPQQAYLVAPDGARSVGVILRRNSGGTGHARMCSLCCTTHPGTGVSLMVARRAGRAGRDGNSVGLDICSDLGCSGYARGWLAPPALSVVRETTSSEQRAERLRRNLATFLARVRR